jgi:FtsP/CotA-like multicopper oxidase with cupredoxin domain
MSDTQGKRRKEIKKKGSRKKDSDLSRRDVLKLGAAAGAASVLAPTVLTSKKSSVYGFDGETVTEPVICVEEPDNSPPHVPFRDTLPIPLPGIPVNLNPPPQQNANTGAGEATRAPHQRWAEFQPDVEYHMVARPALHRFHADYQPSYIWGFNGLFPAQTILNVYGHPTVVRFRNNLPSPLVHTGSGRNEITIHLHNGHHGSESDGFAGDFFTNPLWKDNLYSNIYAGYDAFPPDGDEREAMHSFWFHDHREAFTAMNNYLGLNGMYLVYDEKDPGHEFNTSGSLRLPNFYGITDIPIELTDKIFCATDPVAGRTEMFQEVGNAGPPLFEVGAPGGDKWVVNGKIQPKMTVRRRKYRFRFLNTGPAKTWDISLIKPDGSVGTMVVVATDANFLSSPIPVDAGANAANSNSTTPGAIRISVAERYDVIIDFAQFPAGSRVYFRENAGQFVGNPSPVTLPTGLAIENVLMQFNVVNRESWFPPDTPAVPSTLTVYPPLPPTDRSFTWQFTRDPAGPQLPGDTEAARLFKINQLPFDRNRIDHCILRGTTEEWTLDNNSATPGGPSAWTHPVHIHFEEFRTLKRFIRGPGGSGDNVEVPVPPLMSGRKDVMRLEAGQGALIKMQFRDYLGRYLIHCHNMNHEDAFMMARWDIVATQQQLCEQRDQIIQRRREAGVDIAAGLPTEKDGRKEGLA